MKKNTIVKDALILFAITLIAALALGLVYEITKEPIAAAELRAKTEAYKSVFSELSETQEDADITAKVKASADFLAGNPEYEGVTINEALVAKDGSGAAIGYVMTITNKNGYGGPIKFAIGYKPDGTLTGISFLTLTETAGLGMKAKDEKFAGQFFDVKVTQFGMAKAGMQGDVELESISSATITSKAVAKGVNAGVAFGADLVANGIGGIS